MINFNSLFVVIAISIFSVTVSAKELYVSTSGSDNITYEENSINQPWKSINKGVYSLKAGDTLYIRGGVYTPSYTMYTKNDYTSKGKGNPYDMEAESGTESNRVTIRNFENEHVLIDLKNVLQFIDLDAKSYWTIRGLNFVNSQTAIRVGYDVPSNYNIFSNLRIEASTGGDNAAAIKLEGNAEHTVIEYSTLVGPGTGEDIHLNTSSIYATKLNNLVVRNNLIENAPLGLYFKHANEGVFSDVNILIENNIFQKHTRRSMEINANHAIIRNNLFGLDNSGVRNNEANGFTGGDFNRFINNTFYNSSVTFSGDSQGGEENPGSVGVELLRNIFVGPVHLHPYSTINSELSGDYNLFIPGIQVRSFDEEIDIERFLEGQGQLTNTILGLPEFMGNVPIDPLGFKLIGSSIGASIEGGESIGVNTNNLGPNVAEMPVFGNVTKQNN